MVLSWLMSFVSAKMLSRIIYEKNAYEVWKYIKERFDKVNLMRLYQLHREINNLYHKTDSVSIYFKKLKNLWIEYDVVVLAPLCTFSKSKDYAEHLYQVRLI